MAKHEVLSSPSLGLLALRSVDLELEDEGSVAYLADEALKARSQAVGVVLQLSSLGVNGVALRVRQAGGLRQQQSEWI